MGEIWGDMGEVWGRYGGDMGEIWGRYGGDMGEIWGRYGATLMAVSSSKSTMAAMLCGRLAITALVLMSTWLGVGVGVG